MSRENVPHNTYAPLQEFQLFEKNNNRRDAIEQKVQLAVNSSGGRFSSDSISVTGHLMDQVMTQCQASTQTETPELLIRPLPDDIYGTYFLGIISLNQSLIVRLNDSFEKSRVSTKPLRVNFFELIKWGKTATLIKVNLAHEFYHHRQKKLYPASYKKTVAVNQLQQDADYAAYRNDRGERAANAFAKRFLHAEEERLHELQGGKRDFMGMLLEQELQSILSYPLYHR